MYSLTSANRYYLYQGFVRMNLGIDGFIQNYTIGNEGLVSRFRRYLFILW